MFTLFYIVWNLLSIMNCENPCEKLNFIGDTIQNKAILSPIVIIGKGGMKIDLPNAKYKLTIEIVKTIKGSLGLWKKPILIAGEFSAFKEQKNACQFKNFEGAEQIYFLKVISEIDGEYQVLFDPEFNNEKQLNAINKTICEGCSKLPTIDIQDSSKSNGFLVAECISDGFPPPVVKWIVPRRYSTTIIEQIKSGIRLIQPVNNSTNELYECRATNAIGSVSHSMKVQSFIFKEPVILSRCPTLDQKFCNGNGKCYNDKEENDSKFCRCNKGFDGLNCDKDSNDLPTDLLLRRKELDKDICNNRGKLYENYRTKSRYCECNSNTFGEYCDKKIIPRSPEKDDKSFKEFLVNETSKLAAKYILIGCLIVLTGCVIVVIVIIFLWRFYFIKTPSNNRRNNPENILENNANHMVKDNLVNPIPLNEENPLLLENIKPNKTQKIDKTFDKEIGYKGSNPYPGNGIYDNY